MNETKLIKKKETIKNSFSCKNEKAINQSE